MDKPSFNKEDVIGLEAKSITYVKAQDGTYHDMLVVKEIVHLKDDTRVPRLRFVKDYKRSFYVTHKGQRVHEQKRDYELVKNLQKYTCTQLDLPRNVARILGDYTAGNSMRKLARSPYLYGTDVSSTCLLKNDYRSRWPNLLSLNKVAAADIETNVHTEAEEIICMSVTCKTNACLIYLRSWIESEADPINETHRVAEQYIGDVMRKRGITLEVIIVDTPGQIVVEYAKRAHAWSPDFMCFWNIDFDMSRMVKALKEENIDPAEVFSDPRIPKEYQYFDYNKGPTSKTTASGKVMSINIEDRWNWVTTPAGFQFMDLMPVYRQLRLTDGKDPSYKLDYILEKEIQFTKLKLPGADRYKGRRWHEVLQQRHKIFYGVYNVFDSISLEMLDEHTNDLASKISTSSKNSDFKNFNSNPRRLCDDMHFWYLNRPEASVIGSSSDQAAHELDDMVVSHEGWVVTLPSYMAAPAGVCCIKELPQLKTLCWTFVADLDIVSTYPNISQLLNIARETCVMEFSNMQGIPHELRREVGVNITGGQTNAVEICQKILKAPSFDDLLLAFQQHNKMAA